VSLTLGINTSVVNIHCMASVSSDARITSLLLIFKCLNDLTSERTYRPAPGMIASLVSTKPIFALLANHKYRNFTYLVTARTSATTETKHVHIFADCNKMMC